MKLLLLLAALAQASVQRQGRPAPPARLPAVSAPQRALPASIIPAEAALPALQAAAAPLPEPAAKGEEPSAAQQLSAAEAAPEGEDALWTGGMPDREARAQLAHAHWETTKFFFGSRSKMLHEWVKRDEAAMKDKPRLARDIEGLWIDWRTKGYAGGVTTGGFTVADRETIRKEAIKVWDRHLPRDAAARESFMRYLARLDRVAPPARPSFYRKKAFSPFFLVPTLDPAKLVATVDGMLSEQELAAAERHRAERQPAILAAFREAAMASMLEVNRTLPAGKKIVAVVLLGSYSIGQSTPGSDLDYQLVTQDGGLEAVKPFYEALVRSWTRDRVATIEALQFSLPPSRLVVKQSFPEGYRVLSRDPRAEAALSTPVFNPPHAGRWTRLRGKAFGWFWKAWVWSYFRLADRGLI